MISRFHVSDRNIVGLLLILNSEEEFSSMSMSRINTYDHVMETAIKLRDAGIITSEPSPDRQRKVIWKLTPQGKIIAKHLSDAERELRKSIKTEPCRRRQHRCERGH
jgi:DNA-binding transcriptional ArsR family regulator